MGRRRSFDLATGLRDLEMTYLWVLPLPEEGEKIQDPGPLEVHENREGWGLPQGIRVRLTMMDEFADQGRTPFQTMVVFRGVTTPFGEGVSGGPAGGTFQ